MGNQSQALAYAERFFETNPGEGANYLRAQGYYIIASVHLDRGELDKAEENALKSFQYVENENLIYECFSMETLARVYLQRGNYNKALEYANKSLYYAGELDDPALYVKAYNVLATIYLEQKQYDKSEAAALKAMELNPNALETEPRLAYTISLSNTQQGNKEKAAFFLRKYDEITRSNNEKNFHETLASMEIQYETGKKELHIAALKKEKMFYVWLSIAGITLLLLVVGLLFYRHRLNVQKRRLAEQQVKQLEQEKQLVATQAVLDGETAERTRLARDLHDGLGGMLSAIKLNMNEMKRGATLEAADVQLFDKALGMLDDSIHELRRVAHNMMPDSLSRYGLKTALSDFCDSITAAEFNYYGDESRLENKIEVMIYRIIHELVNNAMKHAEATHILVQIMQETNRIAFTVQDNGRGFDINAQTKGTGLTNIRTRVASYNGNIDISSKIDEGTEVNIELRIKN